jgi:hypothetical protein
MRILPITTDQNPRHPSPHVNGLNVYVRSSVHEPFEVLDLAVFAFEGAAVVGQGQPGRDGLLVAAHAAGEGVECGLVAGLDGGVGGEPVLQSEQVLALT